MPQHHVVIARSEATKQSDEVVARAKPVAISREAKCEIATAAFGSLAMTVR
jgi:hypothetical protein